MTTGNTAAPGTTPAPPEIPTIAPIEPTQPAPVPTSQPTAAPSFGLSDLGLTPAAEPRPIGGEDSGVVEMGLDDESIKTFDFDLYEARPGNTDRISIVDPTSIMAARAHFKPNGGYIICNSKFTKKEGIEVCTHQALCCEKLGDPRKRFATVIVQYTTNPDGSPMQQLGFSLKVWRFTEDKYVQLRNINREYPLNAHDLKVTATGDKRFQKLTLQNCRECFWRHEKWPKEWKDKILLFLSANKPKLAKVIGKRRTEQEMMEIFGVATQPSTVSAEMPLTDLKSLLPSNG